MNFSFNVLCIYLHTLSRSIGMLGCYLDLLLSNCGHFSIAEKMFGVGWWCSPCLMVITTFQSLFTPSQVTKTIDFKSAFTDQTFHFSWAPTSPSVYLINPTGPHRLKAELKGEGSVNLWLVWSDTLILLLFAIPVSHQSLHATGSITSQINR